MDGLSASAGRIGNQVFFVFVVVSVAVSSTVDWRDVDVDVIGGVMAELNFEHVMMCTDFLDDVWKETAAGISSRIERQVSLHIVADYIYCIVCCDASISGFDGTPTRRPDARRIWILCGEKRMMAGGSRLPFR